MEREIIVVTAAYGNDKIKALGGQQAVLPIIAGAGADGVEIRRELLDPAEIDTLPALAQAIASHHLKACYSAPEPLFERDGKINARLPSLLAEAHELNARWLKLSLGHFSHPHQAEPLTGLLALSDVALVVENDQTECGRLEPMRRFLAASKTLNLPVRLTFDMANWLWVDDAPEEAARALRAGVSYIHVKAATAHHYHYRAIALDDAGPRWRTLLDMLPPDAPRGIEFPLEGRDLTAVTRHYVNLLREE
ncbi:sugar phosphate isomerase/epimerase [Cronobacter malonaticus]|uniref:sugar phosphate isomerase/epimerase family protein n=1 Tax=Cronobacter malonaticus TaxID=413503 RepID=UPI000CFB602C|nr:sugar phosphate isomerase/epimerase [Cronobacter malonaticus]MDT3537148.1 sugar phosphate isomerase/epimerase [Cronobacter malonaticus]